MEIKRCTYTARELIDKNTDMEDGIPCLYAVFYYPLMLEPVAKSQTEIYVSYDKVIGVAFSGFKFFSCLHVTDVRSECKEIIMQLFCVFTSCQRFPCLFSI